MYVTLCISRGNQCILSWRMFEVQFDWTFAKLLEVTVASIDTLVWRSHTHNAQNRERVWCHIILRLVPVKKSDKRMNIIK